MERRAYGKTGMQTSVLGFGGSEIGFMETDQSTVESLLNRALDAGLNVIDTAECYMDSEVKIGKAVGGRRDDFYLFTKCGHASHSGVDLPDWHKDIVGRSIENSLRKLQTDRVDLVHLHSCSLEVLQQGDVVSELVKAKEAGKTRFIGYSGDGAAARYALELGVFDSLQTSVNIADQQSIDLLLPYCVQHGIGVIAKRPVANVAWHNGDNPPSRSYGNAYWERLQKLKLDILKGSLSETAGKALRFTLSQPGVCTMIVGTTNPDRWSQNAAVVAQGSLPQEELDAIRARWKEVSEPDWVGLT